MLQKWQDFNESLSISNSTRVSKENFLDKDKKFPKENFTDYEINQIKKIVNGNPNSIISKSILEPGIVSYNIILETSTHFIIIKKLEDEWFLLEQRLRNPSKFLQKNQPKSRFKWGDGFHIADRFEELVELLKFISSKSSNEAYNFKNKSRSIITNRGDDGPIIVKKFQTSGHTQYQTAKLSSEKACCKYAIPLNLKNLSVISFSPTGKFYSFEDLKNNKIVYLFDIEIDDINLEDKFMEKLLNYFRKTGIEIAVLDIMSDDPNMKLIKKFGFDYLYGEEDKDYPYESRMYLNLK